jgi:protein transport protein SEC13
VIIWKQDGDDAKWSPKVLNTFEDPVWRVSWSITGNILAVSSGDANVTLWKEELDGKWTLVNQVEDAAGAESS